MNGSIGIMYNYIIKQSTVFFPLLSSPTRLNQNTQINKKRLIRVAYSCFCATQNATNI